MTSTGPVALVDWHRYLRTGVDWVEFKRHG